MKIFNIEREIEIERIDGKLLYYLERDETKGLPHLKKIANNFLPSKKLI